MIGIIGTQLYQWDTGRSVRITDIEADCVHFANKGDSKAVIMELADSQSKIPDYLLQTGKQLCVYVVKNGITVESRSFSVTARAKPENYVYEEDQRNFVYALIESAQEAIDAANQAAAVAVQAGQNAAESAGAATQAADAANEATGAAIKASENANEAAVKAAHTAKSLMVVGKTEGEIIALDDAIDQFFVGCRIFGKTTQNGTPTPDNPVDLVSIGDSGKVGVSIAGKNLLDLGVTTFSGCSNNGGVLVSNVTNAHYASLFCKGLVDLFMACRGKMVTFSANKSVDGRAMAVVIYGKRKNGEQVQSLNGKIGERFVSIRISDDFENITSVELRWNRSISGVFTDTTSSITDLQVEIGEVATTYEPYKGQTMTIATPNGLPGIPVTSGGNYIDANGQQWVCDEIDLDRGVYIKRVDKIVYDGSSDEYWTEYGTEANRSFYVTPVKAALGYNLSLCDRFENISSAWGSLHANEYGIYSDHGTVKGKYFRAPNEAVTNLEQWNAWLAENPTTLVYVMATPIETPLLAEEIAAYDDLRTYRGHTTISNSGNAHMEIEYVIDAKKYIDSIVGGPVAKLSDVTIPASKWVGADGLYSQVVTIDGITPYSKVDLLPSVEQLAVFHNKDVAFVTENEDGVVTVFAIGTKPTNDYTMQVSITEVVV